MQVRSCLLTLAGTVLPAVLVAQATNPPPAAKPAPPAAAPAATAPAPAASTNPVTDALRMAEQRYARILVAAAEAMPAEKYNYRPTPAQMSFAQIQVHLANEGNDLLCGKVSGVTAPPRATAADTTAGKDALVARLKETFQFCEQAFAKLDDSKLSQQIQLFGPRPFTIAAAMFITVGDWADHYSQEANYLRLNGILPPTAQPRSSM
ncbi:MAG TPA: DinB family protein [Gemmatimonadales bacterium]|nr:DinB family protein [Gemmatimonadales bacterium]